MLQAQKSSRPKYEAKIFKIKNYIIKYNPSKKIYVCNCQGYFRVKDKSIGCKHIQQLNKDYRGISSPTDVLSFEQNFIDPETETFYLGDIIISIEQAQKQAHQAQHSLLSECALLAIHGTLHLLGFDHTSAEEEKAMWEEQNNLLAHFLSNLPESSK